VGFRPFRRVDGLVETAACAKLPTSDGWPGLNDLPHTRSCRQPFFNVRALLGRCEHKPKWPHRGASPGGCNLAAVAVDGVSSIVLYPFRESMPARTLSCRGALCFIFSLAEIYSARSCVCGCWCVARHDRRCLRLPKGVPSHLIYRLYAHVSR
jgi:hypothetical protein